jgi:hypothetical protein
LLLLDSRLPEYRNRMKKKSRLASLFPCANIPDAVLRDSTSPKDYVHCNES